MSRICCPKKVTTQRPSAVHFTQILRSTRISFHILVRGGRDRAKEGRNFSPVDFLLLFVFPLLCLSRIIIQPTSSTFFSPAVEKVQILVKGLAIDDHRIFGCTLSGFLIFKSTIFTLFTLLFSSNSDFPHLGHFHRNFHRSDGFTSKSLHQVLHNKNYGKLIFRHFFTLFPYFQLIARI